METAFQELIEQNKKHIDNKNQQTSYKIKYVTTYVENWLRVMSNAEYTKNLNFIDCMSNSGIYQDGDFCTAMEVLKLFKDLLYYKNKMYLAKHFFDFFGLCGLH